MPCLAIFQLSLNLLNLSSSCLILPAYLLNFDLFSSSCMILPPSGFAGLIPILLRIKPAYTLGGDVPFLRLLAGATERNSAIILHVGLTFIIYKAVVSRKLVWFAGAIALHAAVDFFFVLLFYELKLSTWVFEVTVLAVFILITTLVYKIVKNEFKPTEAPPETISRVEG